MAQISLQVNGKSLSLNADDDIPLLLGNKLPQRFRQQLRMQFITLLVFV